MTSISFTQLDSIANLTLQQFKDQYNSGTNVAAAYYTELAAQGNSINNSNITNYAILAKDVTTNSGVNGKIANAYSVAAANDTSVIDLSVGSDKWLEVQFEIMQRDLAARHLEVTGGNSGELNYQDINTIHELAFDTVNLGPEVYTLYTPTQNLGDADPALAQSLFEDLITDNGLGDNMFMDGLAIDILNDWRDQTNADYYKWVGNFVEALASDPVGILGAALGDEFQDFLDLLPSGEDIAQWISDLGDSASSFVNGISTWYSTTLTFFGVTLANVWDPLVIDIDGDGIAADFKPHTTSGGQNIYETYFDLDGDGFAQAVDWHGDGFLVRDLNSNGRIDNGTEMFGDASTDGFTALAAFDGNADSVIDASDAIWSDLQIWKDVNADGQTQSGELISLSSLDITGINLSSVATGFTGGLTHTGTANTSTGTLEAGSYNFAMEAVNTRYAQDYNFDVRAAFLPTLRGYNQMADLHIAISLDNDETDAESLVSLASDIASYSFTDLFENYDTVTSKIEDLLFRWAGVDSVSPTSRGSFIEDARQLEFVEKYLGEGFVDRNEWGTNPGTVQAREFQEYWDTDLFPRLKGAILSQTAASELFDDGVMSYEFAPDIVELALVGGVHKLSQDALDELEAAATALSTTAERQDFWLGVADFIGANDYLNVNELSGSNFSSEETKLATAIANSDSDLVWAESGHDPGNGITSIQYRYFNPLGDTITGTSSADDHTVDSQFAGTSFDDVIIGSGGADNLRGGLGNDIIYGHNEDGTGDDGSADTISGDIGDDEIYGGLGNDILSGDNGNDHLIGGAGDDTLQDGGDTVFGVQNLLDGGTGDDDYKIFGASISARNYILDTSGYDELELAGSTYYLADATFERSLDSDLRIYGDNSSGVFHYELFIVGQFSALGNSSGEGIEEIKLHDGTNDWLDLKDYLSNYTGVITTRGSDAADTINGILTGSADDLIYAEKGNDIINGDDGDDTIYGGEGDDTISGGMGNDTIYGYDAGNNLAENNTLSGGAGNDAIYGSGQLFGDDGDDTLVGSLGDDRLDGGNGNDTLAGGAGSNIYVASAGNDIIIAAANPAYEDILEYVDSTNLNDLVFERHIADLNDMTIRNGSDTIFVGSQFVNPGSGKIRLEEVRFDNGNVVDMTTVTITSFGSASGEYIDGVSYGGGANDIIYGYGGNDTIFGRAGDDIIDGGDGDDDLDGSVGTDTLSYASTSAGVTVDLSVSTAQNTVGAGIDTIANFENLTGGTGSDTLTGDASQNVIMGLAGDDVLDGGGSDDTLIGGAGDDDLDGGSGTDTADYSSNTAAVDVELNNGRADEGRDSTWNDTLTSIENVIGTAYSDEVIGNSAGNTVHAGDSSDIVYGKEGADTLYGEGGNDALYGEDGDDVLHGGDGADTLDGDRYNLSAANSGNDTIYGGDGADNIWGRHGNDTLYGDADNDIIRGNEGNDILYGGSGQDDLYGHDGNDTLYGGADHDDLYGGDGNDTFVFLETDFDFNNVIFDEIHDFTINDSSNNDTLNISDLMDGYDPLNHVLTDFFTVTNNGTHSYAKIDMDGTANGTDYDQIIKFVNTILTDSDFTVGSNLII